MKESRATIPNRGYLAPLEIDHRRPVAPPGDRHILLVLPGQMPVEEDKGDRGGQGAHPHRCGHTVIGHESGGNDAVDVGCQDIDSPRHADHRGDGKGGQAPDGNEGHRGEDRRPQDRKGHPRQGPEVRGPADLGGFLQGDIEGRHRRGDDQVGDGQVEEPLDEDHPLERVDAERPAPSRPKTCLRKRLIIPFDGLSRRTQLTAKRMCGTIIGMREMTPKRNLQGMFVRTFR